MFYYFHDLLKILYTTYKLSGAFAFCWTLIKKLLLWFSCFLSTWQSVPNESENNFSEQKLTKFYIFQKLSLFIFHVNVKHEIILTLFYFFHHHLSVFILKRKARLSRYIFIEQPYLLFLSRMSAPSHNIIIFKRSEKLKYFKNYLYIIFHLIVKQYITVNNPLRYSISSITLLSSLKRLYFILFHIENVCTSTQCK